MTLVSVIWVISDIWLHYWRLFTVLYLKQSSSIYSWSLFYWYNNLHYLWFTTAQSLKLKLKLKHRKLFDNDRFTFIKVYGFFFEKRKFSTNENKTPQLFRHNYNILTCWSSINNAFINLHILHISCHLRNVQLVHVSAVVIYCFNVCPLYNLYTVCSSSVNTFVHLTCCQKF